MRIVPFKHLKNKELKRNDNITKTILVKTPVLNLFGSEISSKYGGKSIKTKEMRSITPIGFAQAFYEANK